MYNINLIRPNIHTSGSCHPKIRIILGGISQSLLRKPTQTQNMAEHTTEETINAIHSGNKTIYRCL